MKSGLLLFFALMFSFAGHPAQAAMRSDGTMIVVPEYVAAEKKITNGDFGGAIPLLLETVRLYPGHASAWNLLGYSHRRVGKLDESELYYDAALTVNPKHIGALNYMGQLFLQTGRPDKANELLDRLKEICKNGCKELKHLQTAVDAGAASEY